MAVSYFAEDVKMPAIKREKRPIGYVVSLRGMGKNAAI